MKLSRDGYKRNSKDKNNPYNIIPSGDITMEGVDFPVMGTDNLGNQQLMQPGFNYKFPGNMVFEQPAQEKPQNQVKKRRIDRDNRLLPNWTKDMGDVSSHLMTTIEMTDDDGSPIYIAIPMLYPNIEGQETPDPTTWKEFKSGEEQDAFKMALERGEVYYFNSAEEADAFAKGGYKTPNLKKKKEGGSLPKAQDNKEVKDYFISYLNSPLFKRRAIDLHGENEWKNVRDTKLKRLENTEVDFSGEEEWADIWGEDIKDYNIFQLINIEEDINRLQSKYKKPNYNNEGNENPIIKVNPGQAITMAEDLNLSYNPFNSIVANEYSHALGATSNSSSDPFPYKMTDKERELSNKRKLDAPHDSHDSRDYEMKSDIDTTRFELWKAGLYNFEEDFMFDQSHIDYIRNNPDKFIKDVNLFKQYDDDAIIEQMNVYTDNSSMPLGMSKYGGQLPKAQIQDEILQANIEADKWNKEYVQSPNYLSMLTRAKEKPSVIKSRIDEAMNFDPYKHITYDENNYSLGQYYNNAYSSSDGSQYPISTFMDGDAMLNYNPTLFPNHPAYNNPGIATGGWPALAGHELIGHYGVDKLNRKQRKALKSLINWEALDNFAGDSNKAYDHGKDPYEMRANLAQLRYQLDNAGIYDSKKGLAVTEDGEEGDNPFTMEHLKQIIDFNEDGTFKQIKPKFNNEILQFVAPEDIIWMMNNIASTGEIGDDLTDGMMRAASGKELPKAQYKTIRRLANLLGKTDDYKSILPKPAVRTIPFQKRLTFDQTGQVIPQQHMVNVSRENKDGNIGALNSALMDIYSGEPMWFAPTGDTRYLDKTLSYYKNPIGTRIGNALFQPIDGGVNFEPGSGWPTISYLKNEIGNTGKLGINEYPLYEWQKHNRINKGYWDKDVFDKDGNYIGTEPDYDNPILRSEPIVKQGWQNKIEGVFAPDIKFKIFDDTEISRQGHAMHHGWSPGEFQSIIDEGFDAIQLTKGGRQLENILLNPEKFKITHINEMPVYIDYHGEKPPFATGGSLPKAQLQHVPKTWNTVKSILQRPLNINTWIPNTGHISGLNIGATSASNYSANALKSLENITKIKDQELLNSIVNDYSKISSGDVNAQNNLEQFARLNPDALITLNQSDDPYLNAIMNRNKNISLGKDYVGEESELFKNLMKYNPQGLLIESIPTLSGGTTSLTMGPNIMQGNVDPIRNLFVPAKGAGAWQGTNQHTYLMNKTKADPSLIVSGDKGFVSRGNDKGFQGRVFSRNIGENKLNAPWDRQYGIRGTMGQSFLDKIGLLDEQFNLDEPFKGTFMQFYNPPKRDGGSLPKHQIKSIIKHGDDIYDGLNLANKNIKSVHLFDKTKPLSLMDDLGYRTSSNSLKEITNRQDLIKQYNLRNNQYRTVNINDGVLNNDQLVSGAKIAGYNPNAADELAAYMGTTPTLGSGRRAGFEGTLRNTSDILYTGDYPHITNSRYITGNPKNTWTVKSNLWEDDIASLSDQQLFDRITLLDNPWSADAANNVFNVGDLSKFKSMSDINAPHGSILNTLSTRIPNLLQTNMLYGNAFEPVRKPISLIRSDDLNRSLKLSGNKFDTFKEGGSIKDKYNKKLRKFQIEGENNPGWLAKRLYNSVTPIGYNIDQAMVEMLYGEKQPFMWDGVETSFADFQNHPRFKDNLQIGEYIKNASEDLWGMYLGFDQKHNTVSKSKFKPTLGIEDDQTTYYSFNNVDDIMDDIIERGITQDITNDEWQIKDSAAGGFNLSNYQLSRGMDDEKELPYIAYYDEYDFDIPTGLGFNIEGESIVGKPFDIYGRIYYNPETNELIPPSELNANWVDFEKLKQGIAYAESLNGELMMNPESTATGLYGQRFSEIKNMYDGTREEFAKDIDAQNEYFENRYRDNLEGVKGLRQSGIDLYQKYSGEIPNFPYSTTEVAALVNFLGRGGAREYLGYVLRDGNTLESVFPDKYGPGAQQANKTPQEYIEKFNEGIIKKKMGGEVDKLTDRLIKKYEEGGKLTPAGTKHLKSLGMI